MTIVVGSAWRSSEHNVVGYLDQVQEFARTVEEEHDVRVVAVEGDSVDYTPQTLLREAEKRELEFELVKCCVGGQHHSSTEAPERMTSLSRVGNAIFDAVKEEDDVLVYVESDLRWEAKVIAMLVELALTKDEGFDVVAPLVFAGTAFYDIWGFRKNGERFSPFHPFHSKLKPYGLTEVDSVGSCLVMTADVARKVRICNDYALVGWCAEARRQGFKIGVHANLWIQHP